MRPHACSFFVVLCVLAVRPVAHAQTPPTCPSPPAPQHVSWRPVGSDVQVLWVGRGSGVSTVEFGSSPGSNDVLTSSPAPNENPNAVLVNLPPGPHYARVINRSDCSTQTAVSADIIVTSGEPYGSSPVLITEIGAGGENFLRFVELKNVGPGTVSLGNWKILSGFLDVNFVASVPPPTLLPPGCSYLIGAGVDPNPDLHTTGAIRSGSVGLVDPTGRIRDSVASRHVEAPRFEMFYVFTEGQRAETIINRGESFARVSDVDTNDNRTDFVRTTWTPQNSLPCNTGMPPPPPSPLSATIAAGTVTLNWKALATNPSISQYALEVGLTPGATHYGPFPFAADQTSVTFHGVPDGTYYARVRTVNANGTSQPTDDATLVVCWQNCTLPPGQATNLTFQVSGSTVLLSWKPPASGGATGYVLEAGVSTFGFNLGLYPTGSALPYVILHGVPPGDYIVRVRATVGGRFGQPSNTVVISVN